MARCQRRYPDGTASGPATSTRADLAFIFLQAVLIYSDVTSRGFVFKVSSRGTILPLSPKQEEEEEGEEEPTSLPPSSLRLPRVADSGALNLDRTLPAAQTQTQRHINSAHI